MLVGVPRETPPEHAGESVQTGRPGVELRTFLLWGDSANDFATIGLQA